MKTKTILLTAVLLATLGLFSFKTLSGDDNNSKTILISAINGKGENEGFMITYGDGRIEKRPFTTKIKGLDTETWIQLQSQAAIILNEMKGKGYHFVGSQKIMTETMVLEKD